MLRPLSSLSLLLASAPALAQSLPGDDEDERPLAAATNEILVVAERFGGRLDVPQEPVASFDEAEIQALGASSVAELLAAIAPQTGSGRGRGGGFPIVLVNGQRITSFREMRNYPPEAIRRVEVLPEEVALRLGFPANARVVNMILKDNYSNRRIEFDRGLPSRGGFSEWEAEGTLLRIDGPGRYSVTLSAEDRSPLFEAERGIVQPGDPAASAYRSLIADSRQFGASANWTKGLGDKGLDGSLSLNATASRADSHGFSGLDSLSRAVLDRIERTDTLQGGIGFNRGLGSWQLTATLDGGHVATTRRSDRGGGTALVDRTRASSDTATSLLTLVGRPLRLPAGEAALTLKGGFAWSALESRDSRGAGAPVTLRRGDGSLGVSLGLPIASRRENVLAGIGDLSLDLAAGWNHLSDFGTLSDWSAGLTWSPGERLGLSASYLVNQAAPSLTQLGNPLVVTPNVPVYDFARGETVLVEVTGGGNPLLRKEQQRDWKFGATWQVPGLPNATLIAEYFRNLSSHVSAGFPLLTPEIEAAFPGRASRDGSGQLVALDLRPVSFARQRASRARWGINLSGQIGKASPAAPAAPSAPRPPGAGAPRGPGGGAMMGRLMGGGGQGRWSLGLYHTVQFTSRVLIAPGGPQLDLLGGDSLSASGTPRHTLEFNGGLFHKGKGLFVNGSWNAPSHVDASGLPGSSGLRFGAVTRVGANLFVELGEQGKLAQEAPLFRNLRLSLRFENLLDSRQRVSDDAGAVPFGFEKAFLDPRGRVIEFEIRKMF